MMLMNEQSSARGEGGIFFKGHFSNSPGGGSLRAFATDLAERFASF